MSDLRKKHREKRQAAIIDAAKRLLAEKGYRATSIEEIAAAAEVSPATVYNYFNSKSELVLFSLSEATELMLSAGTKVVAAPPPEAEDGVFTLLKTYFSLIPGHLPKNLIREMMVVFFIEQAPVRKKMLELDFRVMGQVTTLLEFYKGQGQLRPEIDVAEASMTMYCLVMGSSMAFFADDDMTLDTYLGLLQRQVNSLFEGFAP